LIRRESSTSLRPDGRKEEPESQSRTGPRSIRERMGCPTADAALARNRRSRPTTNRYVPPRPAQRVKRIFNGSVPSEGVCEINLPEPQSWRAALCARSRRMGVSPVRLCPILRDACFRKFLRMRSVFLSQSFPFAGTTLLRLRRGSAPWGFLFPDAGHESRATSNRPARGPFPSST